jgi:hypothetical protein
MNLAWDLFPCQDIDFNTKDIEDALLNNPAQEINLPSFIEM